MEHFVTLFDSLYLPQGLALLLSMRSHVKSYKLWILCLDEVTHEILTKLNFSNVRLLQLSNLETEKLLQVKATRTKAEYCWTLTPFAPKFVFDVDDTVSRVTYLDADLWFRKNPSQIFREFDLSKKKVLITDHSYAADNDQSAISGQYCVQFMIFDRFGGEVVRKWWEERCIEWCHYRLEDGKFGDQKYLDDWPDRFSELVHVLQNKELILGPWNMTRFPYGNSLVWHFHDLRIGKEKSKINFLYLSKKKIPSSTHLNIYLPYIELLKKAINILNEHGFLVHEQRKTRTLLKKIQDRLNNIIRY